MKTKSRLTKANITLDQEIKLFREFANWSKKRKYEYIKKCPNERAWRLRHTWKAWARDKQLAPDGNWSTWVIKAGRGWGKTRTGAEWVIEKADQYPGCHIALVGRTVSDVRDVMVNGMSGIMAISPPWFMPTYYPSKRQLVWPNGSYATTYSADEPDQMRGPQHSFAWADERASWQYDDAWDQLSFGLRIYPAPGVEPQCVVTTTPRNTKAMKLLVNDPTTHVTNGSMYDNRENLAKRFIRDIERRYAGTRLGRQEIEGSIIDDIDGALWKRDWIENNRLQLSDDCPELKRIVIGVNPPDSGNPDVEGPPECGIIVAGLGIDNRGYVLADYSLAGTPNEWGNEALEAYKKYEADCIVGDINHGGETVGAVIKSTAESNDLKHVPFEIVRASRGKQPLAEAVSNLYQKKDILHVGTFPDLEDQQCLRADTLIATEYGQRRIDEVKVGDYVWTSKGLRKVINAGCTNSNAEVYELLTSDNKHLVATMCHPVYTMGRGFVPLLALNQDDTLEVFLCQGDGDGAQKALMAQPDVWANMGRRLNGTGACGASTGLDTIDTRKVNCFTGLFGKQKMGLFQKALKFITRMRTSKITALAISKWSPTKTIFGNMIFTALLYGILKLGSLSVSNFGEIDSLTTPFAKNAIKPIRQSEWSQNTALDVAETKCIGVKKLPKREPVYNIEVEDAHEYYANGIRVHNCNWIHGERTPDRFGACVWTLTNLMVNYGSKPAFREEDIEKVIKKDVEVWPL